LFKRPSSKAADRRNVIMTYLRFGWPILGLIVMMGMAGFFILTDFTRSQDRTFTTSSRTLVQQAIHGLIEANATYSTEYALWNDAYENTTLHEDLVWLSSNFKPSNSSALGVYRQGVGTRYLYVRRGLEGARADIQAYIDHLDVSDHKQYSLTRDPDHIVIAPSGLTVFDGRLATIAVQPIRPERATHLPKVGPEVPVDFVVFINFVSAETIENIGLSSSLELPELHVSDVAQPPRDGRVGLDLKSPTGQLVARIDWVDARPGSAAFASRFIPIGLVLLFMGTLTLIVTYNLSSRQVALSEQARFAAEEASHQKSSFLANVSHELRTPLNAIIGYSEILEEDALEAQNATSAADAKKVTRAANHLLALINDLLDHSKIEAGKIDFNPSQTALRPLIEEVAEALRGRASELGNQIIVTCDPNLGDALLDAMRLKQCLLNLASNAVKFTQEGTITIAARPVDHLGVAWVRLSVKDSGIGMAQATMDKLFVPFVQADAATSQKFGGTGLGLVITRRLIEAMGGTVNVESVDGKGSTFTMLVPRGMTCEQGQSPALADTTLAA
jgi:signal transduction histidine kinase